MKIFNNESGHIRQYTIQAGTLTDVQLFALCQKFGAEAVEARRKFAGLLPEVFKRKLYSKKGFHSIFEFAAKLAYNVPRKLDRKILTTKIEKI